MFTASLTATAPTTHSRLLNCNAKANTATVLKPKLGKLATCSSVSFTSRSSALVPNSKME
eukprot:2109088-Amphidinium_carterae.1